MLQHVQIEGFWERYKIDWRPHSDVNILVGINGSGKSTLLRILGIALTSSQNMALSLGKYLPPKYSLRLEGKGIDTKIKGGETGNHFNNTCDFIMVNTFDEIVREKQALEQEVSPLTASLFAAIFDTRASSLNGYRLRATETPNEGIRISKQLQEWITVVNDFFAVTNKTFEIQGSNVFFRQPNGEELKLDKLSSGEKQLLIILTKVLVQDKEPFIFLMDEPEISLDIEWQYKLIDTIRRLNPSCQLIMATHSPGIFGDGWNDKLVFMEDLLVKME